jgi:hypothetical protein
MGTAGANNPKRLSDLVRGFYELLILLRFDLPLLFLDFLFLVLCLVFFSALVIHQAILSWLLAICSP